MIEESTIVMVGKYGGLLVLAVLFVLDWLDTKKSSKTDKQQTNKVLSELASANNNVAESLKLLKASMDNTTSEFKQHDERAIKCFADIKEKLIKLEK